MSHSYRIPSHKDEGNTIRYLRIAQGLFNKLVDGMQPEDVSKYGYTAVVNSIHRNLAKAQKTDLRILDPSMSLEQIEAVLNNAIQKDLQNPHYNPDLAATLDDSNAAGFISRVDEEFSASKAPGIKPDIRR